MCRTIRTRYAPSPTGFMHIGNLRTALFEYLVAKNKKGKFILRIEDTDQERYVEGAVELIYDTMKSVGLKHDEGPDIGGPFGPYVQSERKGRYLVEALKLIESGHAYYCFCSEERLSSLKKDNTFSPYDRHCRNISLEEAKKRVAQGESYVIRQKMPLNGFTSFVDEVYGEIKIDNKELEDQVLIKADGFPTYNFANVIDDHDMQITHVVRGSEYLSSTPKYNLLYDAFGYEKPTYIHLPHILGADGQKLSKRHGSTSFADLEKEGFLPKAIINAIALLGWAPSSNQEIFSLEELEEQFDIKGISKSPAVFDYEKLAWFNSQYIQNLTDSEFYEKIKDKLHAACHNCQDYQLLAALLKTRVKKLWDFAEHIDFIDNYNELDLSLFTHKKMKTDTQNSLTSLKWCQEVLTACSNWQAEELHNLLLEIAKTHEVKNGIVLWPLRVALTARQSTPGGATEALLLLGKEESLRRISESIAALQNNLAQN